MRLASWSVLAIGLAFGCGPSAAPAEPAAPELAGDSCADGARQKCDCRAGKGYQVCEAGSYGPCVCVRPELLGSSHAGELARYTRDLSGDGPLRAAIATDRGTINCTLFADRAPIAVANFIGLARGMKPWRDPDTGRLTNRRYYDGTIFHRVEGNFIIQGGDPTGTGTGGPGFTYETERHDTLKHDRPGRLAMARGPELGSNGGQFYITLAAYPYLDRPGAHYTVFGQCGDLSVIRAIATAPAVRSRPIDPVTIRTIRISR